LYLETSLSSHPKFKAICESVGDYDKIKTLADLKKKVSIHVEEAEEFQHAQNSKMQSLNERVNQLNDDKLALKEELETITKIGLENAARVYLERRITGNPYQAEIRSRFEGIKLKNKQNVDKLVEGYQNIRARQASDFERVRNRIRKVNGGFKPSDNLVEDHVKDTNPILNEENSFAPIEGHNFSMDEINKLAGVSK
jgi:hypothetical protein